MTDRHPTENEVEAVLTAFDTLTTYISPKDGTINAAGWREVYDTLANLSQYEVWLGLYNLQSAMYDEDSDVTPVQYTLCELFRIAHEQGLEALT